jgi:hypothetical protein
LAEPLEVVHETPAAEALPSEQTISREEEALLWRSLEKIPELYREPLVLFYREHESVEAVAAELGLSEDAVKQRLSRGRKLLQEEVQTFVESTLRRTAPGRAFSGAVIAALPVVQTASVGAGIAGKSIAAAKSGVLAAWFALLAPFVGILIGVVSQLFIIRATTPAGRERRARTFESLAVWALVIGFSLGGQNAVLWLGHRLAWDERTLFVAMAGFWWLYSASFLTWFMILVRRNWAARRQREAAGEVVRLSPVQRTTLAIGMHLAMFLWVIALAWNSHDLTGAAVVAVLLVVMVMWDLSKLLGLAGLAAAHANGQHYGICCLVIMAVVNLRLDVWMASRFEVSVVEIHQMFPMWLIPVLTVALLAWVGWQSRKMPRGESTLES